MDTLSDLSQDWYRSLYQSVSDPASRPIPLVLALSAGTSGAWFAWRRWINRERKLPPSPRGWPILGNLLDLSDENFHLDLMRLQERDNLPDIFTVKTGPSNKIIVLNSYSAIKDAFAAQGDLFADRPPSLIFEVMEMNDEIFMKSYLDPDFSETKQFVMSALRSVGFGSTKSSEEKILSQVDTLVEFLETKIKNKEPVDINNMLMIAASNVILGMMFNKEYRLDDPELTSRIRVIRAWYSSLKEGWITAIFPRWFCKLFFRGTFKHWREITANAKAFVKQEIEEHLASVDPENPRDFVDIYLTKKKKPVDLELLANTVFAFLPDGMETSGCAISWVIMYIISYPDVGRRVQQEIEAVTAGNRNVTWADRRNLPYTEATIMEVTRISCAVTVTAYHSAIRDCYYRGYYIPAGLSVVANLYAATRDPGIVRDPEIFNPERYLNAEGMLSNSETWIPFGMGSRKCAGDQIARMELLLFVANLVQRYEFAFPENEPVPSLDPSNEAFIRTPPPYKIFVTHKQ